MGGALKVCSNWVWLHKTTDGFSWVLLSLLVIELARTHDYDKYNNTELFPEYLKLTNGTNNLSFTESLSPLRRLE